MMTASQRSAEFKGAEFKDAAFKDQSVPTMKSVKQGAMASLLAASLLFSGEGYAENGMEDPTMDWMPAGIDWQTAEVVVVELEDNVFTPDEITLKVGKPYKLVLDNISDTAKHDLADLKFFHAIVIDRVTMGGVTVNTPHVHNIVLRPNAKATVYLVPVKPSEYDVYCSVPGHREDGMEGYFIIEES